MPPEPRAHSHEEASLAAASQLGGGAAGCLGGASVMRTIVTHARYARIRETPDRTRGLFPDAHVARDV
ncbi:hypothetical protein GCM10020001_058450 [Nonomuraea salmonea]